MEHFAKMAEDWWNPNGKFKPLHIMNGLRTRFIVDQICDHFNKDPFHPTHNPEPLSGLRLLDVGCGGGLLCEPMTRLGASVTGVDALDKNVKTAYAHAVASGLEIDYRFSTIENIIEQGEDVFDVVLSMEVLEHVVDPSLFVKHCATMTRAGGLMLCSTINRTAKAFAMTIVGAEYVLKWLPKGTHQYEKFITPSELTRMVEEAGLAPDPAIGMVYNPLKASWKLSQDTSVNYVLSASKPL